MTRLKNNKQEEEQEFHLNGITWQLIPHPVEQVTWQVIPPEEL
jgi:hypothetical protein